MQAYLQEQQDEEENEDEHEHIDNGENGASQADAEGEDNGNDNEEQEEKEKKCARTSIFASLSTCPCVHGIKAASIVAIPVECCIFTWVCHVLQV